MTNEELMNIADNADLIVKGYAFTIKDDKISIFNLNNKYSAMVMNLEGKMLETNMDAIEQVLVKKIWETDAEFLERKVA